MTDKQSLNQALRSSYYSYEAPANLSARVLAEIQQQQHPCSVRSAWPYSVAVGMAGCLLLALIVLRPEHTELETAAFVSSSSVNIPSLSHLPKPKIRLAVPNMASLSGIPTIPSKPDLVRHNNTSG